MTDTNLSVVADRIEAALDLDEGLTRDVLSALSQIDGARTDDIVGPDLNSTDRILALIIEKLPGWTVTVKGKSWYPNGHWTCSLRKTSSQDGDEYIGHGHGPTLPHSLLAALLRVVGHRG